MKTNSLVLTLLILSSIPAFAGGGGLPSGNPLCRVVGYIHCAAADGTLETRFEDVLCSDIEFTSRFNRLHVDAFASGSFDFNNSSGKSVRSTELATDRRGYGVYGKRRANWKLAIEQTSPMQNAKFSALVVNDGSGLNLPALTKVECENHGFDRDPLPGM